MRSAVIPPILDLTKQVVRAAVHPGDTVVDATVGNGHDTLFLAELVGPAGHVYGFDIQAQALDAARTRLQEAGCLDRATLFHAGHEQAGTLLPPAARETLACAMFNLGYLPGGDKARVTTPQATLTALNALLTMLRPHGILTVHCYTGHEGGAAEGHAVLEWANGLEWETHHVARYDFCNKPRNGEALLVVERG